MPVSGRPTKAALLKMTQGSSGAEMKPFQKTRKAAGTGSEEAEMLAGNGARVARSQTITETAAARRIVRAMTSVPSGAQSEYRLHLWQQHYSKRWKSLNDWSCDGGTKGRKCLWGVRRRSRRLLRQRRSTRSTLNGDGRPEREPWSRVADRSRRSGRKPLSRFETL